jgi:hypothetical protein
VGATTDSLLGEHHLGRVLSGRFTEIARSSSTISRIDSAVGSRSTSTSSITTGGLTC